MDKKYNAIKTLKQLDLSRGARSSLSSASGKSDFLNASAEKRFNEAYAKDFSITPPKKDSLRPKSASPKDPLSKKLSAINLKPIASRPKTASPPKKDSIKKDSGKVLNPLSGRLVSLDYYNKLVKSGALSTTSAKKESPKKESPKKESPKKKFWWSPPPPVNIYLKPQTFKREPNTKAWDYYTKALEIANNYKKDGINGKPLTSKQKRLLDDVLYNIIILLNRNKGDFYEQEELPSLVWEVMYKYYTEKGEDKYNERYSQFAIIQNDEADYTTFEGQLDNLVSTIYEGEEAKK
jgi:hypothetical protein